MLLLFGFLIILIWILASSVPAGVYSSAKERLTSVLSPLDLLKRSRIDVAWLPIWLVIQQSPMIGVGPDGLRFLSQNLGNIVFNGDNMILGTWAAYGLVGLIGLVIFILITLRFNWRLTALNLINGFTFMNKYIISYIITGLFAPHFLWPYNSINALVMLLYGLSLSGYYFEKRS